MAVNGQFTEIDESVTLAEAIADVATIHCANMERVWVSLITSNHSAVDQFVVQIKTTADDTAQTIFSAAADYTAPTGIMVGASGDLTALAANSQGWLCLDVRGLYQVILRAAQASGATTTLTIEIGGN